MKSTGLQQTMKAWLIFIGGLIAQFGLDHHLRMRDGSVYFGGLPDPVWVWFPCVLGIFSLYLAWRGTRPLGSAWKRMAVVALQFVLGFLVYAFGALFYITGTGVDSL